jgi:hypothetical protein
MGSLSLSLSLSLSNKRLLAPDAGLVDCVKVEDLMVRTPTVFFSQTSTCRCQPARAGRVAVSEPYKDYHVCTGVARDSIEKWRLTNNTSLSNISW